MILNQNDSKCDFNCPGSVDIMSHSECMYKCMYVSHIILFVNITVLQCKSTKECNSEGQYMVFFL